MRFFGKDKEGESGESNSVLVEDPTNPTGGVLEITTRDEAELGGSVEAAPADLAPAEVPPETAAAAPQLELAPPEEDSGEGDEGDEGDTGDEAPKKRGRPKGAGVPKSEAEKCAHITGSGKRCKRKARDSGYCKNHESAHGVGDGPTETPAEPREAPPMFGGSTVKGKGGAKPTVSMAQVDTAQAGAMMAEGLDKIVKAGSSLLLGAEFGALMGAPPEARAEVAEAIRAHLDTLEVQITTGQRLAMTIGLVYGSQAIGAYAALQNGGTPREAEEEVETRPPVTEEGIAA